MGLGSSSRGSESRFAAYVEALTSVLGHADRAAPFQSYCTGLLLPGDRKSVEPMAARVQPGRVRAAHQSLHHFVAKADWSDDAVLAAVRACVLPVIERHGAIRALIVNDTGIPKKGTHSVGGTQPPRPSAAERWWPRRNCVGGSSGTTRISSRSSVLANTKDEAGAAFIIMPRCASPLMDSCSPKGEPCRSQRRISPTRRLSTPRIPRSDLSVTCQIRSHPSGSPSPAQSPAPCPAARAANAPHSTQHTNL